MKRILVHIPVETHGEYDIFSKYNNKVFVDVIKSKYAGICPNVGNRLWFQGIVSAIQCDENHLDYWSPTMSKEFINESYDLIVAPMANIFSVGFTSLQETLAERFKGIRIPVYVIACGIQASSYDELDDICQRLKMPASKFISSVYDTGGEFALRGYFTKEFFDRLGFSTAVVTGCPSLYQLGRELKIVSPKVGQDSFIPLLNGMPRNYIRYMEDYPEAVFIDQDVFWREIIDPSYFENDLSDDSYIQVLIQRYGYNTTRYLLENRIKLFPDMNNWREFIRENHFSCSFGSRIHGSIMPILSGIPAILECRDARTREMAEFFNIPFVYPKGKNLSLYDLYLSIDYTAFNDSFAEHFDQYESFLGRCGIVNRVNTDNKFFYKPDAFSDMVIDQEKQKNLLKSLSKNALVWNSFSRFLDVKRRIAIAVRR